MDYQKHYDRLIERARHRVLDCYTEWHHVKPSCLGGTDEPENLVALTPEEHYVAHQLLVKLNPQNSSLVYAANMLCVVGEQQHRSNNKLHGWLRRKMAEGAKKRIGKKNGSFGSFWITNGKNNRRIKDETLIPDGWWKGRLSLHTPKNKKMMAEFHKNSIYITNGTNDKRIQLGENIPPGWRRGRTNGLRYSK